MCWLILTAFAGTGTAASPPSVMLPHDGITVVSPPAFSWTPGKNTGGIYLNVSTEADMSPINVINILDNGTHYHRGSISKFKAFYGRRLYWRLVYDGTPTPVRSFVVGETSIDPYYNVVHFGWPGGAEGWDPQSLDTIKLNSLQSLKTRVGGVGNGADRKLAVSYHVPYLFGSNTTQYEKLTQKLLTLSEQSDVAILVGFDGFEWWRGRPDLWKWWDTADASAKSRRVNVESTGWDVSTAVRGGWRNWGSPFRTVAPHPNISSLAFQQANTDALKALIPIVADWHKSLPPEKKHLLAGVKVGWEVCIGVNYYYPSGADTSTHRKGRQVGYAAIRSAGLATSGKIQTKHLDLCVQQFTGALAKIVRDAGIPRNKIFTHVGVHTGTNRYVTTDAALCESAKPGWSFYTGNAGPSGLSGLDATLARLGDPSHHWANIEWGGLGDASWQQWRDLYLLFEQHRNNKLVASWGGGRNADGIALRHLIDRSPKIGSQYHWMNPPLLYSVVDGKSVDLSWSASSQASEWFLNVTTVPDLDFGGVFRQITVSNTRETGRNRKRLSDLSPGTYHWMIVSEGHGRRVSSDVSTFEIQ